MRGAITHTQFDAIAKLISLRTGPAKDAARLVLVDGIRQADAMREAGCSRDSVWATVRRVTAAAALCRVAAVDMGIPITELLQSVQGGDPHLPWPERQGCRGQRNKDRA